MEHLHQIPTGHERKGTASAVLQPLPPQRRHPERSEGPLYFAFVALVSSCLFSAIAEAQAQQLRIHILNAEDGKPITNEQLNIYIGTAKDNLRIRSTDSTGNILLEADPTVIIRMEPTQNVDCREYTSTPIENGYHVDEILRKGISAENSCGKARVTAESRELILYERPLTYSERFWRWFNRH